MLALHASATSCLLLLFLPSNARICISDSIVQCLQDLVLKFSMMALLHALQLQAHSNTMSDVGLGKIGLSASDHHTREMYIVCLQALCNGTATVQHLAIIGTQERRERVHPGQVIVSCSMLVLYICGQYNKCAEHRLDMMQETIQSQTQTHQSSSCLLVSLLI